MDKRKDSFVFYSSYDEKFKDFSLEDFGKLVRFMCQYQKTGEMPEIDNPLLQVAFSVVKVDMDINNEKYIATCEKRIIAGRKGGETRVANQAKVSKPSKPSKGKQMLDNKANEANQADMKCNDMKCNDMNNYNNIITREDQTRRFKPPTYDEVRQYCQERKNNVNAEHFVDYYAARGWKLKNTPMKDWRASVRYWEQNSFNTDQGNDKRSERTNSDYSSETLEIGSTEFSDDPNAPFH